MTVEEGTRSHASGDVVVPRAWLEGRLTETPPELAREICASIEAPCANGLTSATLADIAIEVLERVGRDPQTRDSALALLAADALLTYAFESASDLTIGGSAETVTALAARLGPRGRIGDRATRGAASGDGEP